MTEPVTSSLSVAPKKLKRARDNESQTPASEVPDTGGSETLKAASTKSQRKKNARDLSHLDSPTRHRIIEHRRQRSDYSDMATVRMFSPSDEDEDKSESSWVRRGDGEAFDVLAERPMSEWRRAQLSTALRLATSRMNELSPALHLAASMNEMSPKRSSPRKTSSK